MKKNERILEVDLDAISNNVRIIKKYTGKKLLACVKCDGYGLGAVPISKKIEPLVDWFGTATVEEGILLRKAGITRPILVLGPIRKDNIKNAISHRISITLPSQDFIDCIPLSENVSVHIKVDTGMGRIGIMPEDLYETVRRIKSRKNIKLEGIFSHFSDSENPDRKFALEQVRIFQDVLKQIPAKWRTTTHMANSGGIINVPESFKGFSMVRTGLLLYGVYPCLFLKTFKCLPSLKYAICGSTEILFVRNVDAGTRLSYGGRFVCQKETRIGIAGIGYGDGLSRALSNNFYMKCRDSLLPIRGNICMDQTILELNQNTEQGDRVVFLDSEISAEDMAEISHTVPHEILTRFGVSRMKKIYRG